MNNEALEKVRLLQVFIKEFAEMHKEEQIAQESFSAFVITLESITREIEESLEK